MTTAETTTNPTSTVDAVVIGAGFSGARSDSDSYTYGFTFDEELWQEWEWSERYPELAESTLFPTVDSWYMGANIPGKPRVFLPNLSFVGPYRARCESVAEHDYEGFTIAGTRKGVTAS